ncbi:duf1649 domain protein [Lichtheimia corymbifera JMRC:FSU:9682]|uniref:Autophagy-related protein 101 n=1 Tax=Lichtheimia corymbifera JMRC:FSU:9682 TaxID=1263082 RepID=A0A068S732_9FUNG|nr:duf1649 domain protein [Lichtheimia corymbifera JMRC:FSU:9682]
MTTNAQEFNIEMTSVPKEHVKDVLRALLHSIFFHRLLVNVAPRELRFLDTTVATTDNREVDHLIEQRATEFFQTISSNNARQGKIAVLFYEQRDKKIWYPFSKAKELVCWERWAITINLAQPQSDLERQRSLRSVEHQLSQCLLDILRCANDHKEHIPSIKTIEGNPFPYHIAILTQSESWGAMIRRLLVTDAPATAGTETDTTNAPISPTIGPSQQRGGGGGGATNFGGDGMARPVPGSSNSGGNTSGHQSPSSRSPRRFE